MRPHRLQLSAFGPFPGTAELDFDALSGAGLFLLHGDTGAGKSTLLDAVGFALFGTVPGARSRARRFRSDYAESGEGWLRTEVTLEVTIGGRRIRVTRAPEQDRPRRRGSGMTNEPARVLLEELRAGGWEIVSTRVAEADAEIGRLIGMSAEQFFQVVLLPQGEFARFLRADSAERAVLLERLFATDRFGRAEDWLVEERRRCHREAEAAREAAGRTAARVAQAAGVPDPAPQLPGAGWAEDLLAMSVEATERTARRRQAELSALQAARVVATAAAQLAERQLARRQALAAADELAVRAAETDRLVQELDAAARAAEVRPLLDRATAVAEQMAQAVAGLQAARAAAGGVEPAQAPALVAAARDWAGQLEALQPMEAAARQEEATARDAARCAELHILAREEAERQAEHMRAQHAVAAVRLETARAAVAVIPTLRARAATLTAAVVAAREREAAEAALGPAQESELAARSRYLDLRAAEQRLREGYLRSLVTELAAALEPGAPCPVCGGLEHPHPAPAVGPPVGRLELDQAAAEAERAGEQREQAARTVTAVQERLAAASRRLTAAGLADQPEPTRSLLAEDLEEDLAAADAELASQARWAAELPDLQAAVAALEQSREETARQLAGCAREEATAVAVATAARATAEQSRAVLLRSLAGAPDVAAALAAVRSRTEVLAALVEAAAVVDRAEAERRGADRAAAEAAAEHGFGAVDAARAALRTASWRRESAALCRAAQEDAVAVRARLAAPELAVDLAVEPGLAVARDRLADCERCHQEAVETDQLARHRATELARLIPEYRDGLAALAPRQEREELVTALADLCTGRGANTRRMTLSAFVLAARLEEVAAAASERLLRMTQGRYCLVHTDTGGRSGVRTGLGLLARDSWTGQDRDTATLSGGETFLASLALALGLADVVLAEAGGAPIEALFVDEGFGTLDETTLEEVMDVLDGLREGGRLVGLVSHVSELQSRIPAQVQVHKGRSGSRLTVAGV